jgi:rRNA maturation endonuclease Nob1
MRHVPEAEPLDAMKKRLRDLEKIRLLSPTDLEVLTLRRNLQKQIALLESQLLPGGEPRCSSGTAELTSTRK